MKTENKSLILAFFAGFFSGMGFFFVMDKNRKRRITRFDKIKSDLNNGFLIDKENLSKDWQHIYSDFDKSFNKMKRDARV